MSSYNSATGTKTLLQTAQSALPLGSIRPKGWLLDQLLIQSQGATGHLEECWESVSEASGWLGGTGDDWERGPYYCDGLVPLAYLLGDEQLIARAQRWIDWTLGSQTADGNFGPQTNLDYWPRMVMLKVLIQYYEATGDERVPVLMTRYFAFLKKSLSERPLEGWGKARGGELLYSIYWLYDRTGDQFLLEVAETVYHQTMDWTDIFSDFPFPRSTKFYWSSSKDHPNFHLTHGVNLAMAVKQPGLFYRQSGDERHRSAAFAGIANLAKYHGHVTGIFSSDEHLTGRNPVQGNELCAVVEYMFSLETLLEVYGDVELADLLEKVGYNALPAAVTKDWWSHQYYQQPNQVIATKAVRQWYDNHQECNLFGLDPHFGCCTANMHQGWPKLAKTLWMTSPDEGLTAVVYAPCSVTAMVGGGHEVTITEETEYPFDGAINFKITCQAQAEFPLRMRIPSWCTGASVNVNGELVGTPDAGCYFAISREWRDGDTVTLTLPMSVRLSHWYSNSIGVERGPLVFALRIDEDWRRLERDHPYPNYEVLPKSPWNYALVIDKGSPDESFEVQRSEVPAQPFDAESAPVVLRCKARRLKEWCLQNNSAGELPISPVTSDEPLEEVELIPYGAAKLRISEFPYIDKANQSQRR